MPRETAFLCLRSGSPTPLREVDRFAAQRGLDERDTGLARRLVGTEIRRRGTLRAVLTAFAHAKPKADLATLLRLGIAQLLFLDRVPDHAAISETVRCVTDHLGLGKGRTANAVLRSVQRSICPGACGDPTRDVVGRDLRFEFPVFRDPEEHPHLWAEDALSLPSALHKRWTQRMGREEADRLAHLALEEPPLSIRIRSERPREEVQAELVGAGVPCVEGAHPRFLLVAPEDAASALASPLFHRGEITVQGEHAFHAALTVGEVEGRRVLDLCAAPGGKTAALLERAPGHVVACDLSPRRLQRIQSGFQRLGLGTPGLLAMDKTAALRDDASFEAVLVDAPCSNTGVLAQRPGARWRHGPQAQKELVHLQRSLLLAASAHVEPGGVLVHSTCSLENEENEQQVRGFLRDHPEWVLEQEVRSTPRSLEEGGPTDGGYAARLRAPTGSPSR